ncbi:hypothetical protein PO909_002054 [Leuciscus waleckii]
MPILKQIVAGSQTKRRSRMDLTTEMISAPLGDFRHTMHVGRSGEAFGDTSFLSTRSGEPSQEGHTGGGMKKAESVMSFHVDLGPSMLGEILGVMEKEDDDQGFEEGKSSEGHASPLPCNQGEVDMDEEMREIAVKEEEPEGLVAHDEGPMRAPSSVDLEIQSEGTSTPEPHQRHLHHLDSCSNSSSGSAAMKEKTTSEPYEEDIGITDNTCNPDNEPAFSSFMEDEDDEIRV